MTDVEQQVRHYLSICVSMAGRTANTDLYAYAGPADLVLRTGRIFTPHPFPARYTRGMVKQCFNNAFGLAARTRGKLRYCEGYAAGVIPVEHAWCIDAEDRVVDPTWTGENLGELYFGIVIDLDTVRRVRRRGRTASALFDWEHCYPLCQRPQEPVAAPIPAARP
jgi:hypothetical protein